MHFSAHLSIVVLVSLAGLSAGCNNQSEGDLCSPLAGGTPAGTNDCQSGLVCTTVSANQYRCCPPNRQQATTSACEIPVPSLNASPAAPEDAGNVDSGADMDVQTVDDSPAGDGASSAETGQAPASDGGGDDASGSSADAGVLE